MKIKKILKTVVNIIIVLFMTIALFALGVIVVARARGKVPSVFGYNFYVIISPSMEPDIQVGDVILSKEYTGQRLNVGDVITYLGKEGSLAGKVVTHEIIEITGEGETLTIVTQGTANNTPDPAISGEDVMAVMAYKTVIISFIYNIVGSTTGFLLLVVLPLLLLIITEVVHLAKVFHGVDEEENAQGGENNENEES